MSNGVRKGPVTELAERRADLEAAVKKSTDELLRAMADFDSYRRRVERDAEQRQRVALEALLADLLPVMDNFERALLHIAGGQAPEQVEKGIELIHRQLCDVLSRHGLERYSVCGQEFDPRRAEAVSFVHTDEHKPNVVVEEVCKGYECRGRVVRPARVVVSKPKPAPEPEVATEPEDSETDEGQQVV
ncbi:nucleotide exchange factor GrpE [candidate division WOR-3 bacterium]|nr:nucleotide exchange factor GrpE [candidate division WOR-3 bacterium]